MESSHAAADSAPLNEGCSNEAELCDQKVAGHKTIDAATAGAAPVEAPGDGAAQSKAKEELAAEIVRQVEFYFSDANLPTDAFMLKQVRGNPDGWVPIKVIASFNKMKKLARKLNVIAEALRGSEALEVSPEGMRVRRKAPLPDVDLDAVRLCTVMADNLPEKPTIEWVMETFAAAGEVAMVRICKLDASEPLLTKGLRTEVAFSNKTYALVEYRTPEQAQHAVATLNDTTNWRTGLRVRPLLREHPQRSKDKKHGRQQHAQHAQHGPQQQHQAQHAQHAQQAPAPLPPPTPSAAAPLAPVPSPAVEAPASASAAAVSTAAAPQQRGLSAFDMLPPVPPVVAASAAVPAPSALTAAMAAAAAAAAGGAAGGSSQPAPQSLAPLPASAAADGWVSLNILEAAGFPELAQQPSGNSPAPVPALAAAPAAAFQQHHAELSADAAPWTASQPAPAGAAVAAAAPAGAPGPSLAVMWRAAGAQAEDSDDERGRAGDRSEGGGFMHPGEWKSLNILEELQKGARTIRTGQELAVAAQHAQQAAAQQGLPVRAPDVASPRIASPGVMSPTGWAAMAAIAAPRMLSPSVAPASPPAEGQPIKAAAAAAPAGLAGLAAARLPAGSISAADAQLRGLPVGPTSVPGQGAAGEGIAQAPAQQQEPQQAQQAPPAPPASPPTQWGHLPQTAQHPQHRHAPRHIPHHPQTHVGTPPQHRHHHRQHHQGTPPQHHGTPPQHQGTPPQQHQASHHPQKQQHPHQGTPPHKRAEWQAGPRRSKADYAAWASGATARAARESGGGAAAGSESGHSVLHSASSPHGSSVLHRGPGGLLVMGAARQPTMPDGTRGFAMGRGRPLQPPPGTVAAA